MGKSIKILNTNKIFYGEEIIRLIDFKVEGERMTVKKVELINRTENVLYADEHGSLIEKDYGTNVELEEMVEKIIYTNDKEGFENGQIIDLEKMNNKR